MLKIVVPLENELPDLHRLQQAVMFSNVSPELFLKRSMNHEASPLHA